MKLSYTAFKKRMTVPQLIMQAIQKSHDDLTRDGSIPLYDPFLGEKIETFNSLLDSNLCGGILEILKVNTIQVGPKGVKIDQ